MKIYRDLFDRIASPENLFAAWEAFQSGKRDKPDVRRFEWHLEENIFRLHRELVTKTYRHRRYSDFYVRDPKQPELTLKAFARQPGARASLRSSSRSS